MSTPEERFLRAVVALEALPEKLHEATKTNLDAVLAVRDLRHENELHRQEDARIHTDHDKRIVRLEDADEKTGTKSYAALEEQLKTEKESKTHWGRYGVTFLLSLLASALLLWLGSYLKR